MVSGSLRSKFGFALSAALLASIWSSPAGAELSGDVVKIGVLTDMQSIFSDWSGRGSVIAASLAIEEFRAAHREIAVELVSADHQMKPDVASLLARRWISQDGVDVIVDVAGSTNALAVSDVARGTKTAVLISGATVNDLSGKQCSPNTVQWTADNYALAQVAGRAAVGTDRNSWFFLTSDFSGGHSLEESISKVVLTDGGKVLGKVRVPLNMPDVSSFLIQAQSSGAKMYGLVMSGTDFINAVKLSREFNVTADGTKLAGFTSTIREVHALGLPVVQGMQFPSAFYWDRDENTRSFAKRFAARDGGNQPSEFQAGVYSSVVNYLASVANTNSDDASIVLADLKSHPTQDLAFGKGFVRDDGRMVHDMLLGEAKSPSESKYPWDYYTIVKIVSGKDAVRPLRESECPLVKQ